MAALELSFSPSLESEQCSPGVTKLIGCGRKRSSHHTCSSMVSWKKKSSSIGLESSKYNLFFIIKIKWGVWGTMEGWLTTKGVSSEKNPNTVKKCWCREKPEQNWRKGFKNRFCESISVNLIKKHDSSTWAWLAGGAWGSRPGESWC